MAGRCMNRVLLLEDDQQISRSLSINLKLKGFDVSTAESLKEARLKLDSFQYDILLFDINLPDGNSLDLCHEIKNEKKNSTPVVFLSANIDEETVVKAFSSGGDDYIRKPFGMDELYARIKKSMQFKEEPENLISWFGLEVSQEKRMFFYEGLEINFSRKEFDILYTMMRRKGDVLSRDRIIELVGDSNEAYDRTIDSHISHIRKKLKDNKVFKVKITPVYGVGYKLEGVVDKL